MILLESLAYLRVLPQHFSKEVGNFGVFPLVIDRNTRKCIEEDRRRPCKETFTLTFVAGLCLDQVVLADATRGSIGLAYNHVAEADTAVLVRWSDAAAYAN
jgi:hypothetical protein